MEEVESIQLNNETWNQVRFIRHNSRYKPAFNLAKLFYHNSSRFQTTRPVCIIDAKYKDMLSVNDRYQIQQSDIYQMLAYSVGYKCNHISLVYPRFLGDIKTDVLVKSFKIDNYGHTVLINLLLVDLEITPEALADECFKYLRKSNGGESNDENCFFQHILYEAL